jgi:hypothetical protein
MTDIVWDSLGGIILILFIMFIGTGCLLTCITPCLRSKSYTANNTITANNSKRELEQSNKQSKNQSVPMNMNV